MIRIAVLASGEGTNLQALLDAARAGRLGGQIVLVVSDRPDARALERARAAGVEAVCLDARRFPDRPAFDRSLKELLDRYGPDLVVLAGFMRLLGPELVEAYRHRILNIHPTLLPAFPGLGAHRRVLAHGVKVSGCTVHFVDEGVDTGPIVLQAAVPVAEDDDEAALAERVKRLEHRVYPLAVRLFAEGRLRVSGRRVHVALRPGEREEVLAGLPPGAAVVGPLPAEEPGAAEEAGPRPAGAAGEAGAGGRRRALVSVSDKRGIVDLCRALVAAGWEVVASGGTAAALEAAGVPVTPTERLTGFGQLLGGRVKTLHPAVHAGILVRDRQEDLAELAAAGLAPFQLVVCNLYPFEEAAASGACGEALLEQIDVGGPAMIRAAAKNWPRVTVLVDPDDYDRVVGYLQGHGVPPELRRQLAIKAFRLTAYYDAVIAAALAREAERDGAVAEGVPGSTGGGGEREAWPEYLAVPLRLRQPLRYGENPHQAGALYAAPLGPAGIAGARCLQGKELSYNNLVDADAAWRAVREFAEPACVAVKHATPCGVALGTTPAEAFRRARDADPVSIFGGIVAFNRPVDGEAARELAELFLEVVVAPAFTPEARQVLAGRRNLRLLEVEGAGDPAVPAWEARAIAGGWLLQEADRGAPEDDPARWRPVTRRRPSEDQLRDLAFAWRVVKHVRSNAIVVAAGGQTLGIGGGQTSRVAAVEQALQRAGERAAGAVLASDAFFPFPDSIEAAARAGIAAIVQPGGSVRDAECIAAADAAGIAMVFTGVRHFRH